MTSRFSRFLAAALAFLLTLSAPLTALAEEFPAPAGGESAGGAELLAITVPDYTPDSHAGNISQIQAGGLYTLIVLPASDATQGSQPKTLTPELLLSADPLFVGHAVALENGKVTFTDIRLRTAESAVYYVTGPGLTTPLAEATGLSVSASGSVIRKQGDAVYPVDNATVSLVDKTTGYSYANSVQTAANGSFYIDRLSPGEYLLHVEKPGYLPFTSSTSYAITDDEGYIFAAPFDISAYIGDVDNNGVRDLTDLTGLLSCYGKSGAVPAGLTPDLDGNGNVDYFDVFFYLNAATSADKLTWGVGNGAGATLTAKDISASSQTDRSLVFSLNNGGDSALTFTAASVSLTFRTDYIQPINANGGVVAPGSANTSANCLIPKSGVTVSNPRWSVNGDLATLTFALSCSQPAALTDLVEFRYRPAPGKTTADFFQGVFSIDHAATQVGQVNVLTGCTLEYPNSAPLELDSIAIDLADTSVTIPADGHTVTMVLSATGQRGETTYPDLSGVTWSISGQTGGVSISDNLLTITSAATPGALEFTATRGDVTSAPLTITLENAASTPHRITIQRPGLSGSSDALSGNAGDTLSFSYAAQVIDQYSETMTGQTVTWSLSGAPAGIAVSESGELSVADGLPAGTYTFSLHASLDDLRAAVNITLTLESHPARLVLSGSSVVQIPSGTATLALRYLLSAIDSQGNVIPTPSLNPIFTAFLKDGGEETPAGIVPSVDMSGNLTLTISNDAQAGDYTLRVTDGDLTTDFNLTLQPPQEETSAVSTPVRAALFYEDAVMDSLEFIFLYQELTTPHAQIFPYLLDKDGNKVTPEHTSWTYQLPDLSENSGISYLVAADHLELDSREADPGVYFFTITAQDSVSGLSASISVKLTILPDLNRIELDAPETLSIPTTGTLRYAVGATYYDSSDNIITPPGPVIWYLAKEDGDPDFLTGVTMEDGELTVTSAAKPGTIHVNVRCEMPPEYPYETVYLATATHDITLVSSADEKVLALRRDGQLLEGGVDAAYGKEGSAISLSYTPVLLDRATGEITELTTGVTWLGAAGTFSVDGKAEPGVYSAPITAVYQNQSVSLTAQITVYPDITTLYVIFDDGDTDKTANRYSFPVPVQTSKTYHGTVMAQIKRDKLTRQVPLAQLGLTDYDIDIYTPLTGIYTAYDKATGRLALTIEPLASSNSMADPGEDDPELRYLAIDFSYYPGQDDMQLTQAFLLFKENPVATTAILRRGSGTGSKFVFETTRGESTLQTAPGVLSECYALELLDQYGNPIVDQAVTWELTGSPTNASGDRLIDIINPGSAITSSYPRYQSIRRLRIAPDTPAGEYSLTLTASAAGFTRTLRITLTVSGQQTLDTVTLTGPTMAVIPMWYAQYNSATVNNEKRTLSFVAVAQDPQGNEVDATLCDFSWSVTDSHGNAVSGVTVTPNTDNTATATVTVDRNAKPTATTNSSGQQTSNPVLITVSATPKGSDNVSNATAELSLTRGSLVPTLMRIQGATSHKLELTDPTKSELYTFSLVNQYNEPVSERDARSVTWSWNEKNVPSYVTLSKTNDSNGHPAVRMRITNPGVDSRGTVTLTAAIVFDEASTSSGKATVYQSLSIPITIGNPPVGGGGLGGDVLPEEVPITTSTFTPTTSKSGTTGTSTLSAEDVDAITKTTATGMLTIAPQNTSGLTSITVNFPASVAKAIAAKSSSSSLRIQTSLGTLILSRDALSSLNRGSGNISITILNQDNKLAVTFRSAGTEVKDISKGTVSLQAPVKGDMVTAVSGSNNTDILHKAVITNGSLSVTLSGSVELTLGAKGKVFSDTQNHWAKAAVEFVTARDLFQGTSETTFSPNADMTRSMVVTVLHRLENTPATSAANLFSDVPSNTWYTTAVIWANDKGIVKGTGDGFLPNDPVTREQLATILYRYMTTQNYNTAQRTSLIGFSDSPNVSSWAQEAMEWAVATGLITGKGGGILDPGGNASRAEVATMLERLVRIMTPSV